MISVRINAACWVQGARVESGALLSLPEAHAQSLLDTGRAQLVDDADRQRLVEHRDAQLRRAMTCAPRGVGHIGP